MEFRYIYDYFQKESFMSKSKDKGVTKSNKPKLSVKEKKEKKKTKETKSYE
jgi:hypothetical protein